MNKEFIILSDGNIAVTNEEGHISKRTYDNNPQKNLLSENKIEIIADKIEELQKDLNVQETIIMFTNFLLKLQPIFVLVAVIYRLICVGLTYPEDFINYALPAGALRLISSSVLCGLATICLNIIKKRYKKKVNTTKGKIKVTENLKKEYEQELANIKEKTLSQELVLINEPISLVKQTENMEHQIEEDINKASEETLIQPKKLTLAKRKKQNNIK